MSRPHPLVTALHRARIERGWSETGLARRMGVSGESVRRWEAGLCAPSLGNLSTWAEVLGLEVRLAPSGEAERWAPPPSRRSALRDLDGAA